MTDKPILSVSLDEESGRYRVTIPAGSTVPETVFAFAVVVKVMVRDGIVDSYDYIYDMLKRYVEDPQFDELKEDDNETE